MHQCHNALLWCIIIVVYYRCNSPCCAASSALWLWFVAHNILMVWFGEMQCDEWVIHSIMFWNAVADALVMWCVMWMNEWPNELWINERVGSVKWPCAFYCILYLLCKSLEDTLRESLEFSLETVVELADRHENRYHWPSHTRLKWLKLWTAVGTILKVMLMHFWRHQQSVVTSSAERNRTSETRDRCVKIVVYICCLFVNVTRSTGSISSSVSASTTSRLYSKYV